MSLYFFHVMDGKAIIDADGTELASLAEARLEAVSTAGRMISEMGDQFWGGGRMWTMSVADMTGTVVFTLRFSADDHGIDA